MKRILFLCISILLYSPAIFALATPPDSMNYQGVLLSDTGVPENGDRDMKFHFFDDPNPASPENEILVDSHLFGGAGPVTVATGLFNVQLGGGTVTDGSGAGVYADLSDVFRDFAAVYLEIRVRVGPAGGAGVVETLSPRVRIVSVAYSLNARRLEGLNGTQFLRSDATTNYSSGSFTLDAGTSMNVNGTFRIGGSAVTSTAAELNKLTGTAATVTAPNLNTLTAGPASIADALHTHSLGTGIAIDQAKRVVIKDDFLGGSNLLANTDAFFTSELLYRAHVGVDVSEIYFDQYRGQNGVIEVNSDDASPTYITTDDFPFRLDRANMLFQSRFATSGGYGGSKYWSGLSDQEVLTPNNCVRFTWVTFSNLFAEIRRDGSLVASVDTGVAMPSTVFHTAELRMVSATAFEVWVDGTLKGTLSATMPTVNLNYVIYAESPGGGQNAGNAVDFWALSYER